MMYKRVLLGFCAGVSLCGGAYGDIRVLFAFDDSTLIARKVVEMPATEKNYPATVAELPVPPQEDMVIMKWLDVNGQLLAVTQVFDPRVISSPDHINPSSLSEASVTEGAWMEYGPDGTDTVMVEFPENVTLGLGLETWSVSLPLEK